MRLFEKATIADVLFGPGTGPKDWALGIMFIAIYVIAFIFVGWLILQIVRGSRAVGDKALHRIFNDMQVTPASAEDGPIVKLKFTMYTMFLFWGEQRVIEAALPYLRARTALRKILEHNLMKGWLGPGGVFVPILTVIEYRQQRKNLALQASSIVLAQGEGLAQNEP